MAKRIFLILSLIGLFWCGIVNANDESSLESNQNEEYLQEEDYSTYEQDESKQTQSQAPKSRPAKEPTHQQYFGIGVGYGPATHVYEAQGGTVADSNSKLKSAIMPTIFLGYKYFGETFGFRAYFDLFMGDWKYESLKMNLLSFGLNADFLVNFINASNFNLGIFAGAGVNYGLPDIQDSIFDKYHIALVFNGGIRMVFAKAHEINFFA
ncbi:hypothetical protein CCY99_09265, partial [Helicobacter sp. 16-1353]|uniref:outer membrane beta-barrel protein n=1 Tax=Helicobacter sp. 16-1353 TaxID=2004996 RepID=UPI000DCC5B82